MFKGWKLIHWVWFIILLVIFIAVFILIGEAIGIKKESGFYAYLFHSFLPIVCSYAIVKHIKEKEGEIKIKKSD